MSRKQIAANLFVFCFAISIGSSSIAVPNIPSPTPQKVSAPTFKPVPSPSDKPTATLTPTPMTSPAARKCQQQIDAAQKALEAHDKINMRIYALDVEKQNLELIDIKNLETKVKTIEEEILRLTFRINELSKIKPRSPNQESELSGIQQARQAKSSTLSDVKKQIKNKLDRIEAIKLEREGLVKTKAKLLTEWETKNKEMNLCLYGKHPL